MHNRLQVQQLLDRIPPIMQQVLLWQEVAPKEDCFNSTEPFFIDTMSAEQWLQWVFLPRMYVLLERELPLPERLAIAPYFEEVLQYRAVEIEALLVLLRQVDALFTPDINKLTPAVLQGH